MEKTTYFIELHVDEGWFNAISDLTAVIHDEEICEWIRVQPETTGDEEEDDE
jgi:hypothetical protein